MRPPRWEYRSLVLNIKGWVGPKVDQAELDATMNALGAEGWELVSAVDMAAGGGQSAGLLMLFRRALD